MSHRIRHLLIASLIIILLAVAADAGNRQDIMNKKSKIVPTPAITQTTIDPKAIEDTPKIIKPVTQKIVIKAKPEVSAEAYLVGNLETGEIYIRYNNQAVDPIASLSKLITAIVATHNMPSEQKITITDSMLEAYGDAGHLKAGETLTVSELLYPMLLESSNDAAEAYAQSYGYQPFIQKMDDFASSIGMTSTSFKDASGLNPGNISNANDLFKLSRYLYNNEKGLLDITRKTTFTLATTTDHQGHVFYSINPFPLDPHFIGGKTGRTDEAKESMISMFSYVDNGKYYPVVIIVLRSDFSARQLDTSYLLSQFIQKVTSK